MKWLNYAEKLNDILKDRFYDEDKGCYYSTQNDSEDVFLRMAEDVDGVEPSANGLQLLNLSKLFMLTGKEHYKQCSVGLTKFLSDKLSLHPSSLFSSCLALLYSNHDVAVVKINARKGSALVNEILSCRSMNFNPYVEFLFQEKEQISEFQICQGMECRIPSQNVDEIRGLFQ